MADDVLQRLAALIRARRAESAASSYTRQLIDAGRLGRLFRLTRTTSSTAPAPPQLAIMRPQPCASRYESRRPAAAVTVLGMG